MKESKIIPENKFILDASSAFRQMWFNKNQINTIYLDLSNDTELNERYAKYEAKRNRVGSGWRPKIPTLQGDFRKLDFPNETFQLIVWDPPHLKTITETSMLFQKYGCLNAETWQGDIRRAATELWRCLRSYGVLIFKWSNSEVSFREVLKLFPIKPLFGNISSNHADNKTAWFCFMKIPEAEFKEENVK